MDTEFDSSRHAMGSIGVAVMLVIVVIGIVAVWAIDQGFPIL